MNSVFQPPVPDLRVYIPEYALPHRVDIWPVVNHADDAGGRIPSFPAPRVQNVPCVICDASAEEKLTFQRLNEEISHTVGFAQDPLLQPGDKLTFRNPNNPKQPRELDVRYVKNADELNVYWAVTTNEILELNENV